MIDFAIFFFSLLSFISGACVSCVITIVLFLSFVWDFWFHRLWSRASLIAAKTSSIHHRDEERDRDTFFNKFFSFFRVSHCFRRCWIIAATHNFSTLTCLVFWSLWIYNVTRIFVVFSSLAKLNLKSIGATQSGFLRVCQFHNCWSSTMAKWKFLGVSRATLHKFELHFFLWTDTFHMRLSKQTNETVGAESS